MKKLTLLFALLCASVMGWADPITYCEYPTGHLKNANFDDVNGRILLTIQKGEGNSIVVTVKNNNANGNTKTGLNYLWVNATGATNMVEGKVTYGSHSTEDTETVSVVVEFSAAQESYTFNNIHWAYAGWGGEWAIDGLTVSASELCTSGSKQSPELALNKYAVTLDMPSGNFLISASRTGTGAISYETSDNTVASVSNAGLVEAKGVGTATITVSVEETEAYAADSKTLSVTVVDWTAINWLPNNSSNSSYTKKYKAYKGNPGPSNIVDIEQPGWAGVTGPGIYVTFPNAEFGTISLASDQYKRDGAGLLFYMTAFTELKTEVSVVNAGVEKKFTVCNANLDVTAPSISAASVGLVTENAASITVTASDNVGIAEYIVYNNGVLFNTYTSNEFTLSGLTSSTTYSLLTVVAKDANDNTSSAFAIEEFTTSSALNTVLPTDESRELCQVQGVLGTSKYPATGFTRYESAGWGNGAHETITIDGKSVEHITSGTGFAAGIGDKDIRDYTHVKFDIWCATAETFGLQIACWNGGWQNGTKQTFTTNASDWKTIDLAISGFELTSADLATSVLLYFRDLNNTPFYITNVFYYTDSEVCSSEPETAPTAPMQTDCQVYSLFSDYHYVGQTVKLNNATWCGGSEEEVTIAGKKVKKLSGSTGCYGFEVAGWDTNGTVDVSDYDYMHIDVWVPQTTTFEFRPINRNAGNTANEDEKWVRRTVTTLGSWQSLDIPVSEFTSQGLSMERLYQFKFEKLAGKKVWFTNLYFYKTAECTPDWTNWNLALNQPAYAGLEVGGSEAYRANNDKFNDRWATGQWPDISTQWWYVDLGDVYDLTHVDIFFENARPTSYVLQVASENPASDESKWTTVYTGTEEPKAGTTEVDKNTYDISGNAGRWIRIKSAANNLNGEWGFSMYEFRAYASGLAQADANPPVMESAAVYEYPALNSVTLTLTASDAEGEVNRFRINNGTDNFVVSTDASNRATVSGLAVGRYTFTISAIDGGNNISENSIAVEVKIFDPADNLALDKDVVAGYTNPSNAGEAPEMANDGNYGSPWTTFNNRPMEEQWWSVDLGDVYDLSTIDLFWDVKSDHYLLQVAHAEPADRSDDTQWYTALEVNETQTTGGAEANKNRYAVNASARYVRFKAVEKAATYLKLWEFRVYGTAYADADVNTPEITDASVSYNEDKAILTLEATDTEDGAVNSFRVINTTTNEKKILYTNGDNQIILDDLTANTLYTFEIQAMDKAANLSAVRQLNVNIPVSSADNIAKNKPVYAGFETGGSGEAKEKANDGNPSTFWATWNTGDVTSEWLYVDLQGLYDLKQVVVTFNAGLISGDYILQYRREEPTLAEAADDDAWEDIDEVTTASTTNLTIASDASGVARYIRFRTKTANIRLAEIEVYANAAVVEFNETSNTPIITANEDAVVNAEIARTFTETDEWYTLCLPFDLSNEQLETAFGAGYTLAEMTGAEDRGSLIHLNFDNVHALEAGKAYLLRPSTSVTSAPTFAGVQIKNVDPHALRSANDYMEFEGTFNNKLLDSDDQRFVGPDNYLYMPAVGGTTMKAFRCFFTIPAGPQQNNVMSKRAKIVFGPQQTTDIDLLNEEPNTNGKFLINGELYIIRDGKTYNAQGQLVK